MIRKIGTYFVIIFLSIIFTVYLFEGFLIWKFNGGNEFSKLKKNYENKSGKKFDTRSRYEIYTDKKKSNNNIVIDITPSNYLAFSDIDFFPLSGISMAKTIFCNENGYYAIYDSDRYGYNNPDKEWNSNQIHYLLIGDSFTQGACVNRPNDISSVLRGLTNKSVINLGFGGNGTLIQYGILREYLKPNVKNILWMYYEGNDLIELNDELKSNILKNYLKDPDFSQNLIQKQDKVNLMANQLIIREKINAKERKRQNSIRFQTKQFILLKKFRSYIQYEKPEYNYKIFKQIIEAANNLALKNNAKLYFVYLPEISRYKNNYDMTKYSSVKKIINSLDIPMIDIHERVFKKNANPLDLFTFERIKHYRGHYTISGYKQIAESINQYISK